MEIGRRLSREPHHPLPHGTVPIRTLGAACGILVLTFAACPQERVSSDTVTHALTAWSLVEGRGGFVRVEDLQLEAWSEPPRIYMLESRNGQYVTGYGIGVAALLVPIYAGLCAVGVPPSVILANRTSQAIATVLMIIAVAATSAAVGRLTTPKVTGIAVASMALGSPVLSLLSRELWQQTVLTAAYAVACWLLFRPGRLPSAGLIVSAGVLVGWTLAVRPTAGGYCILWIWAVWRLVRTRVTWFAMPIAAWGSVVALYQWIVFGKPWISGQSLIPATKFGPGGVFSANPLEALIGVLASPGVGLLVFSPIFAMAFPLVWSRTLRELGRECATRRVLRDLALAAIAINLLVTALYREWWGGWGYGPRYPADSLVFLVVALALSLWSAETRQQRNTSRRLTLWASVLLAVSFAQHAAGLLVNPYGERSFNRTFDIDHNPEVLWDWRHMPSLHNLRVTLSNPSDQAAGERPRTESPVQDQP